MELKGRVALVTGGSGPGMGRSIALALAREGADVAISYRRRQESAQQVAAAIAGMGRRTLAQQADITKGEEVRALVEAVLRSLGRIDILVNNAGGPWRPQDIIDIEPAHWRRVMASEIDGAFYAIKYALPIMRQQGWGRIINIGGYLADQWRFNPQDVPIDYPLGKAARHWLTRTLAPHELRYGITINAVAPGPIPYVSPEEALAQLHGEGGWPERRRPTPQDVAEAVAFLASEKACFITGSIINVTGS